MVKIDTLIRKNIQELKPYSSAREEFVGEADVYLDANENPFPSAFNRYPDPLQKALKEKISSLKNILPSQIFIGNGSDEAIDLLIRCFCEPGEDSVLIAEPTYSMYSVCASINAVEVVRVSLTESFDLDVQRMLKNVTKNTKLIFLCSPNNPSGNLLGKEKIETILKSFNGLVVVDEAYIDFTLKPGFLPELDRYENLVILQTLSKSWGLAGLRLGMCFASRTIISILNKVKYPYNINAYAQQKAIEVLGNPEQKADWVNAILEERAKLEKVLPTLSVVWRVFPSDANFLLVEFHDAKRVYQELIMKKIIVRDRSNVKRCDNCLRITVGTPDENEALIQALKAL